MVLHRQYVFGYHNTGVLQLQVAGTGGMAGSASLSTNTWAHVTVSFNNSNQAVVFYSNGFNGAIDYSITGVGSLTATTAELEIGSRANHDAYINAHITEFRSWNLVRTTSQSAATFALQWVYGDPQSIFIKVSDNGAWLARRGRAVQLVQGLIVKWALHEYAHP